MNRLEKAIVRCGEPGQYDQSSYGSVCKCMETDGNNYGLFLQLSQDENTPRWQHIGKYNSNSLESDILRDIEVYLANKNT